MKASVFSHEHLIGSVELEVVDAANDTLAGEMLCAPHYSQIAHILQDINSGLPRGNTMSMEELRINVQLENGCFLFPAQGFSIVESTAGEPLREVRHAELRAVGVMPYVIENFFDRRSLTQSIGNLLGRGETRRWLVQPWQAVDVTLKLKMEDELLCEIGLLKGDKVNDDSTQESHPLAEFELCALAQFNGQRESLFAARHRRSGREAFVQVHLTWSGSREREPWPSCTFYDSYESFRRRCVRNGNCLGKY